MRSRADGALRRRGRGLLIGALLAAAGCTRAPRPAANDPSLDLGPRPPRVTVEVRYATYEITAPTLAEIRAQLRASGPAVGARRWEGRTAAHINWTYRYDVPGRGTCRLRDPRAHVRVEITMPEWKPPVEPNEEAKRWWSRYHAALLEHERGHGRIAIAGAGRAVRALELASESTRCDELGARANADARRAIADLPARQAAFDRETQHGAIQIREAVEKEGP